MHLQIGHYIPGHNNDYNGYVLKNDGNINKTLQTPSNSTSTGTTMTAGYFTQATQADRWELVDAETIANTLLLIDEKTNTLADNLERYVAPEETRTLDELDLAVSVVSESSNGQGFTCSLPYTTETDITITYTDVTVTGVTPNSDALVTFSIHVNGSAITKYLYVNVTAIAEGRYFLRNKESAMYADIESQIMGDGRTIYQWEFHGGNTQKWNFTHLGDGAYSIHSENSTTKYYLGVSGDSSAASQPIVLRAGTITNGMKWTVELTENDSFKLVPKSGESSGRVLATSSASTNGAMLIQDSYLSDDSYEDEWEIRQGTYIYRVNIQLSIWILPVHWRMFRLFQYR